MLLEKLNSTERIYFTRENLFYTGYTLTLQPDKQNMIIDWLTRQIKISIFIRDLDWMGIFRKIIEENITYQADGL